MRNHLSAFLSALLLLLISDCSRTNYPFDDPANVKVGCFIKDSLLVAHPDTTFLVGDTICIGLSFQLPHLIDTCMVSMDGDTTFFVVTSGLKDGDSIWLSHAFPSPGQKLIRLDAAIQEDNRINDIIPVTIRGKPAVVLTSPEEKTVTEGYAVLLFVAAEGTDTLTYKWYHNKTLLTDETDDTLLFSSVGVGDSGVYYCIVNNEWGEPDTSDSARLHVLPHTDNLLDSLYLSAGVLSPGFDPNSTAYRVNVPYADSVFSLTAIPHNPKALVTFDPPVPIALSLGDTTVTITVTLPDSASKMDYTVRVSRQNNIATLDTSSKILVAPLIFAPTKNRFEVNAVVADGDPKTLRLFVQRSADKGWTEVETVRYPAFDIVEWSVTDLSPGTVYPYAIVTEEDALKALEEVTDGTPHPGLLFLGKAVTQREPGASFSFALIADTHLRPHKVTPGLDIWAVEEETLLSVVQDIEVNHPDFIIHLGDVLDFHDYGFNDPPPSGEVTRWGYLNYRRMLADMIGNTAHFMVIGNWEGENGNYDEDEIDRSREQRLLYAPGPEPSTYPQGGSPNEDYYAFTWGDALFIVLNVMTYTPTPHLLSSYPGLVDDWTLGKEQMAWFEKTLANATAKWRFVLIHHTVGGKAGNLDNSAYGRGGGRAAYVGEQAKVHALMLEHGVQIFFYAHDHVFTDMVVDKIHYTLPGSAGAIWKFVTEETGYTKYRPESGHGLVTVTPQNVLVEFIAEGGEVINRYTVP